MILKLTKKHNNEKLINGCTERKKAHNSMLQNKLPLCVDVTDFFPQMEIYRAQNSNE